MKFLFTFLCLLSLQSLVHGQDAKTDPKGFPVIAHQDTLFYIQNRLGSLSAKERAERTSEKVAKLADDLLFVPDSVKVVKDSLVMDIAYKGDILMSLSKLDADSVRMEMDVLAKTYQQIIVDNVTEYKKETDVVELLKRAGLGILILSVLGACLFYLNKFFNRFRGWISKRLHQKLSKLKIKDYELINRKSELLLINKALHLVKFVLMFLLVYLTLPLVFRLFPWTKPLGDHLMNFVLNPLKNIFSSLINFIPNLITILVIFFVFHYVKKLIKFLAGEIESEKLKINGFYPDWAKPTYNIIKLVLNAFMLVVIWPFIPGSNSEIFKGVSVFLGLLISFGSSSAISNGVAGMVITYMRPFKVGDVVKIGDITGSVLEKSLLVTRLKTIKNEIITIPNSAILNGNTVNYTSLCVGEGLIIHTTLTLGYDIPWAKIHELLIGAALATEGVIKEKQPFVLQTSLDDWYVSYQLNAYVSRPDIMAVIYSELHKNIHEAFDAAGVEIMSPHYQAMRDGNASTLPNKAVADTGGLLPDSKI